MIYDFDKIIDRTNTNSVKYEYRKAYFGTDEVLPMWVADMDFETPDFVRTAVIERAKHPVYGYTLRGEEFKESIISWMLRRHNWKIDPDWIVFSPGIVPALNLSTLCYTEPGESVLVQPPVYFPFFGAVKDHKRKLLENNLNYKDGNYSIDFIDFEKKAREAKLFFLCHPHNPVGRMWNREELEEIVRICRDNEIIILSDEIHSDLILSEKKHIPLLNIEGSHDITAACYAPSKTFNLAGLSTSFLVIPDKKIRLAFERKVNQMHLGMGNIFGNVALQASYDHGENWLEQLLEYLRKNYSILKNFIENELPEIKLVPTEATYLVWLDFRALKMDDNELREFVIKEAGLGLNDGPSFGRSGSGFQRINIAVPEQVLRSSLEMLKAAIHDNRKR